MPVYPCKCDVCGNTDEVFRKISEHRDLPDCCGVQMKRVFTPHMVYSDLQPYQSPLDGKWISSRSQHRKHMKEHGVIEVGNEKLKRTATKQYNPGDIKQDIADAMNQHGIV